MILRIRRGFHPKLNLKSRSGFHSLLPSKKSYLYLVYHGQITLLRGHSDTGKTTALLEAAVSAQKRGILPVFIITEMKWNWDHVREMGLEIEEKVDKETGEVTD